MLNSHMQTFMIPTIPKQNLKLKFACDVSILDLPSNKSTLPLCEIGLQINLFWTVFIASFHFLVKTQDIGGYGYDCENRPAY